MKKYIIFIFIISCLSSCYTKVDISDIPYVAKIVVEGSIENGGYASVLLSVSAPVTGVKDTVSLLQYALRSAKVTVSDGEQSEILYLRSNREKIPPYEYRGRLIKGVVGKHYSLKIEYDGNIITSSTYIPAPVEPDNIWFKRKNANDTVGQIGISFKNQSEEYYRISTCPHSLRDVFNICLYGNINSRKYEAEEEINIELLKGPTIYPKNNFSTYYHINDTIKVKLSTQPQHAYEFWNSYQNELLNAQNPIFPTFSSLRSNVSGGIGIWSGYGSNVNTVILSEIEQ